MILQSVVGTESLHCKNNDNPTFMNDENSKPDKGKLPGTPDRYVDGILRHDPNKVSTIARVQLVRSVKSHVAADSVARLELLLASEFCDPIPTLLDDCALFAAFIPSRRGLITAQPVDFSELCIIPCKFSITLQYTARFSITFPTEMGPYQLFLFTNRRPDRPSIENDSSEVIVLPLLTGQFLVISAEDFAFRPETMLLLSCYRIVNEIIIEEEYGKMLGSHIYDSSIAILRYIKHCDLFIADDAPLSSTTPSKCNVALELGAGCGLVSIWLSKLRLFDRVIATDMTLQLPLIERNVKLSDVQDNCACKSLDWSHFSMKQKNSFQQLTGAERDSYKRIGGDQDPSGRPQESSSCTDCTDAYYQLQCKHLDMTKNERLKMIVAGDVLYSKELAEHFFSVLRALAEPNYTVILVAQKLRNLDSKDSFNVRNILGFDSVIVWQEAKVVIWRLSLLS